MDAIDSKGGQSKKNLDVCEFGVVAVHSSCSLSSELLQGNLYGAGRNVRSP